MCALGHCVHPCAPQTPIGAQGLSTSKDTRYPYFVFEGTSPPAFAELTQGLPNQLILLWIELSLTVAGRMMSPLVMISRR